LKKIFLFLIVFLLAVSISNAQQSNYDPLCNTAIGGVEIDGKCFDCGATDNICPDIVIGYEHCGLEGRPIDPDCVSAVTPDTTPPAITDITTPEITQNSAKINWTTNEDSNSSVEYGITIDYGSIKEDTTYTQYHSLNLIGLALNTLYHYKVCSTNRANNKACSDDYTFTTLPITLLDINNPAMGGSKPDCLYDPDNIETYNCRDNNNDLDNDNQNNNIDNDIDGDGIPNNQDSDNDNDNIPDTTDIDDDNDGIPDTTDTSFPICITTNAKWVNKITQIAYSDNAEIQELTEVGIGLQGTNCYSVTLNLKLYEIDDYWLGESKDEITTTDFPTTITFNNPNAQEIALTYWSVKWIEDTGGTDNDPEFRFRVVGSDVESQIIKIKKVTAPVTLPACTPGDPCIKDGCDGTYNSNCNCVDVPNDNCPITPICTAGTCSGNSRCDNGQQWQSCGNNCCYQGTCNSEGTINGQQACIRGSWQTYAPGECGKLTCNDNGCMMKKDDSKCGLDYACKNTETGFKCDYLCDENSVCCFCYTTCRDKAGKVPGEAPQSISDCDSIAQHKLFELPKCK